MSQELTTSSTSIALFSLCNSSERSSDEHGTEANTEGWCGVIFLLLPYWGHDFGNTIESLCALVSSSVNEEERNLIE